MGYTIVNLKDRIVEMYPEIEAHGIIVNAVYSELLDSFIVTFRSGNHTLSTHLDKKDADACIDGTKCISLGVQIGLFLENFREQSPDGATAQKVAGKPVSAKVGAKGYLLNFNDWNRGVARDLAGREGLKELTGEQLEVIRFIRDYYQQYNYFPIIQALCRNAHKDNGCMNEKFLTPLQAWKIAGLPEPDAVMLNLLEHNEPPT